MGRLILLLLVVVVIVVLAITFGTWWSWMNNHNDKVRLGLGGSKKRLAELESSGKQYRNVLREIHDIADTNRVINGDPIWDLIISKTDQALNQEEK
jgi:hypothetical protein